MLYYCEFKNKEICGNDDEKNQPILWPNQQGMIFDYTLTLCLFPTKRRLLLCMRKKATVYCFVIMKKKLNGQQKKP